MSLLDSAGTTSASSSSNNSTSASSSSPFSSIASATAAKIASEASAASRAPLSPVAESNTIDRSGDTIDTCGGTHGSVRSTDSVAMFVEGFVVDAVSSAVGLVSESRSRTASADAAASGAGAGAGGRVPGGGVGALVDGVTDGGAVDSAAVTTAPFSQKVAAAVATQPVLQSLPLSHEARLLLSTSLDIDVGLPSVRELLGTPLFSAPATGTHISRFDIDAHQVYVGVFVMLCCVLALMSLILAHCLYLPVTLTLFHRCLFTSLLPILASSLCYALLQPHHQCNIPKALLESPHHEQLICET
jgi:hypothetical protein